MTLQQELEMVAGRYAPHHRVAVAGFLGGAPRREAMELFTTNPCLGLLLVYCADCRLEPGASWDEARRRVMDRRPDILEWLGFPASRSAASIVGKVDVSATSLPQCRLLRRLLRDPQANRLLCHASEICGAMLEMLANYKLRRCVVPSFYGELCCSPNPDGTLSMLREVVVRAERDNVRVRRFCCCEQVTVIYEGLTAFEPDVPEWSRDYERIEFPEVPVNVASHTQPPGLSVAPIRSPRDLYREALEQHSCVFDLMSQIRHGEAALYRVVAPERLTVMLVPAGEGFWRIRECRGRWNRDPGRDALLKIGAYFTKRQAGQLEECRIGSAVRDGSEDLYATSSGDTGQAVGRVM